MRGLSRSMDGIITRQKCCTMGRLLAFSRTHRVRQLSGPISSTTAHYSASPNPSHKLNVQSISPFHEPFPYNTLVATLTHSNDVAIVIAIAIVIVLTFSFLFVYV